METGAIEQAALPQPKTAISKNRRTGSGTVCGGKGQNDPGLAHLIEVWPNLQAPVKRDILNLMQQQGGDHA